MEVQVTKSTFKCVGDELSYLELQMVVALGLSDFVISNEITVMSLYEIMVAHCFVRNLQGPAVESLRRCFKALYVSETCRRTSEFDALIKLY